MLSGDNSAVVARVANQVGIEPTMAYGDLSPEQKVNVVKKGAIKAGGTNKTPVIMVGDGANDAAALAAADVGIAVRGGAEVSLQAAPVYVSAGELSVVASLIRAARSSRLLIYTTFGVSITYNLIAVTLAVMGQISPLIAAILMPISSVTVLTITLAWPVFMEQKK
jgi:P-type Cu2+ transporter